jgi:aerobic-type carbon monoxide dehydrogenase small subunit (CoxS/CutS family)
MSDNPSSLDKAGSQLSRRAFIKGAGAAAVVAGIGTLTKPAPSDEGTIEQPTVNGDGIAEWLGPEAATIELNVNGAVRQVTLEPRVTLLEALRDNLGLYGTKLVCGRGACGTCTVHLDGSPVISCLILAADARRHQIVTIEGLANGTRMHPVQRAFVENDALQCGFCTPGMIMSVAAALSRNPNPDLDEIKRAVSGNICRCGTYPHIFKAALAVATNQRDVPDRKI